MGGGRPEDQIPYRAVCGDEAVPLLQQGEEGDGDGGKQVTVAIRCMNPAIFGDGYDGFIYFIQMGDIGPIKIGYAKKPDKRFKHLQWSSPYELKLLYVTPANLSR